MVDLKDQWHLHWVLFQTWEDSTKNTGDETWDYCLDSEILLVQKPVLSTFEESKASKVKHQAYAGHPSVQKRDCSQETGSFMPNRKISKRFSSICKSTPAENITAEAELADSPWQSANAQCFVSAAILGHSKPAVIIPYHPFMPELALNDFKFPRIKFQLQECHFQHNPENSWKTAWPPTWDSKKSVPAVLPPEAKMLDAASVGDYYNVKTTTSNKGEYLFHY